MRLGDLRTGRRVDWERRWGRGTHESGTLSHRTLSRETRGRGAQLREVRTRGHDKQTSPDFCT